MPQHLTLFRQDADIEPGHEHDHLSVLVRPADTDVVKTARVSQCHGSACVDPVAAHPRHPGQIDRRPCRPCCVSRVDLGLELLDRPGGFLLREIGFERLVEPLDLPAGLGVNRVDAPASLAQPCLRGSS